MNKIKNQKNVSPNNQQDYLKLEKQEKISNSKDYTCSIISSGITACALHKEKLDLATVLNELTETCSRVIDGKTVDIELALMMQAKTLHSF